MLSRPLEEIQVELLNFHGTEHYHRLTMVTNLLVTDGVKYLADSCGAYWLLDVIASHLSKMKSFNVIVFKKNKKGSGGKFTATDDLPANHTYAKQTIAYTDFPLPEIRMYLVFDGQNLVLMLPTEY